MIVPIGAGSFATGMQMGALQEHISSVSQTARGRLPFDAPWSGS